MCVWVCLVSSDIYAAPKQMSLWSFANATKSPTKVVSKTQVLPKINWYYPLKNITFLPITYGLWLPFADLSNDQIKVESLSFGDEYIDEFWLYRGNHLWYDQNKNAYTPVNSIWDGVVVASDNYLWSRILESIFSTGEINSWKWENYTFYEASKYLTGKYLWSGIYSTGITITWYMHKWCKVNRNRWWIVIIAHIISSSDNVNTKNIYIPRWNALLNTGIYMSGIYMPNGMWTGAYSGVFFSLYGHIYWWPSVGTIVTKWQNIWYISPANTPSNWYRKESHLHLGIYKVNPRNKSTLPWYYNYKYSWDTVFTWRVEPIRYIANYGN